MKRFHVHVAVNDLPRSVAFYSRLFGQAPAKERPDYAKWMLEDPRLNFAISARGQAGGLNHFGMQADSADELADLRRMADAASDDNTLEQAAASCCYASSQKHWTVDPQGIAWEHFLTMGDSAAFGEDAAATAGACCIPIAKAGATSDAPCCVPKEGAATPSGKCCGPAP